MKNDKCLKTLQKRSKKFVKSLACAGLAGCMLVGGNLVAHAATLDDVFDAEQYANDYPDLKAAFGYDRAALLNHYRTYGILEGRKVSGLIDIAKYRDEYPDLYAAFGDDWDAYVDHFLTFGILEGRDSGTDFDVLAYAERYADLKEALGDNFLALYQHYQTIGKTEGRIATTTIAAPASVAAPSASVSSSGSTSTSSNVSSSSSTGSSSGASSSGGGSTPETSEDGTKIVEGTDEYGNATKTCKRSSDDSIVYVITYDRNGLYKVKDEYNDTGDKVIKETWISQIDIVVREWEYHNNGTKHYERVLVFNLDGSLDGSFSINEYDSNEDYVKTRWFDVNGKYTGWSSDQDGWDFNPADPDDNEPDSPYNAPELNF